MIKLTSRSNYGRIVNNSMGCFLEPPQHPSYHYSVRSSYGDTFSMSIQSAATCEWLDPKCRGKARGIMNKWYKNIPDINSGEVQAWILEVLGYFRHCYIDPKQPADKRRNASNLLIKSKWNQFKHWKRHAGVLYIRETYPNYRPTVMQFIKSKWGS